LYDFGLRLLAFGRARARARDSERERKGERTREGARGREQHGTHARMHAGRCLAQVHETLHAGHALHARRRTGATSSPQHTVGDKRAHDRDKRAYDSAGQSSAECRSRCARRVRGRQALERLRA
jgi:hypothetical protein